MNLRVAAGVIGGGLLGFAIGAGAYLLLEPVLESATDWVRETQGLAWNLVPLLTVVGAVVGGLALRRRGGRAD